MHAHAEVGYVVLYAVATHRPEEDRTMLTRRKCHVLWQWRNAYASQEVVVKRGREGPAAFRVFTGVVAYLLYRVYQASERDIVDPYLKKRRNGMS